MDIIGYEPNEHAIGIIMKELVRRAIKTIRKEQFKYEVEKKVYYDGISEDICTSADKKAQEIYIRSLLECFPTYGIIAEESDYQENRDRVHPNLYFSCDPLDGTKAFDRKQSHGVGTMLSLSYKHEVVASYIGDVNTQEIYGFRPNSENAWRINEYESFQKLHVDLDRELCGQYLLLLQEPAEYSLAAQRFIDRHKRPFKSFETQGGSIGISMARLWKGEVGGVLLPAHYETPWDSNPVFGINHKMGFVYVKIPKDSGDIRGDEMKCRVVNPVSIREKYFRDTETLIVHSSRLEELRQNDHIF